MLLGGSLASLGEIALQRILPALKLFQETP